MDPIFTPDGDVCGWVQGSTIRDLEGGVIAFLFDSELVGTRGSHLGQFVKGNFRDHSGAVVAWTHGARDGPLKPLPSIAPIPPVPAIPPVPPIPPIPPIPPVASLSWSSLTWEKFIELIEL